MPTIDCRPGQKAYSQEALFGPTPENHGD